MHAAPGEPMRYHCYLEGEPTLDSYRLSHRPWDNYSPVFLCPFLVLTSESGKMYNLMRGIQGQRKGEAQNYGTYLLDGKLDQQCRLHFPFSELPVAEPYRVTESADAVIYAADHFRLEFGVSNYRWVEGAGRADIRATRLGQVATFWIPVQQGYDHPQMLRSHLGKATGTIDGEAVEGLFMLDYIYSRPDAMWTEMGMLTKLHHLWMNWLVEYEDGSYEGGYAWRSRPGTGFAAAHHVKDGVSTARTDAELTTQSTARGTISHVSLRLGSEVSVELEQYGSTDWPLHTCGIVKATSRGKRIRKSWNYTEYFPLNWWSVANYMRAHRDLYGKYPSFQRMMENGKVIDDVLVFEK
jgi:hypothetical protein